MPRRNVSDRSKLGPHHVYNRARAGRALFREDADRDFFIDLLASRLTGSKFRSPAHRRASRVTGIEVNAMCLMTTQFHLIVWQHEGDAMRRLMQSVLTGYVRHHNDKYGTRGPLFAGPYRSRPLVGAKDLRYTTAYIHANHPSGPAYKYSSHAALVDDHARPGWLTMAPLVAAFAPPNDYAAYMQAHATRAGLTAQFF
jgi:hypothetical protein